MIYLLVHDYHGDPSLEEQIAGIYLTRERAEFEQGRWRRAVELSKADGGIGTFDRVPEIVEFPLDEAVSIGEHTYLHRYLVGDKR